jgi:outer membrane immunogenic protein
MKKWLVIFAGATAFIAVMNSARAADLPYGAPYAPAPAYSSGYNWTGPYAGLNLGYEWGSVTNNPTEPNGIAGGIQGGYNYQSGNIVVGAETDLQLSGADDTFAPWKFSNPWFGSLRGRIGGAMNNVLLYATGGLAYGSVRGAGFGFSDLHTNAGWTLGAGLEVGLTQNWSVKAEYLYFSLGESFYPATNVQNGFDGNVLRLGVNYHF